LRKKPVEIPISIAIKIHKVSLFDLVIGFLVESELAKFTKGIVSPLLDSSELLASEKLNPTNS